MSYLPSHPMRLCPSSGITGVLTSCVSLAGIYLSLLSIPEIISPSSVSINVLRPLRLIRIFRMIKRWPALLRLLETFVDCLCQVCNCMSGEV